MFKNFKKNKIKKINISVGGGGAQLLNVFPLLSSNFMFQILNVLELIFN
jgi:hypothetical protein